MAGWLKLLHVAVAVGFIVPTWMLMSLVLAAIVLGLMVLKPR